MQSVSPVEARLRASTGEAALVDIREEFEAATARVPGAIRLPMGVLLADPSRAPSDAPLLLMDHEGTRSRFAAEYLRGHGVDAVPVEGGALAYLRSENRGRLL